MRNNQKGFTLVEMIATITIFGIVTLIALPAISNISDNSTNKKYELYKDSMEYAAKLYIDEYAQDEFGTQKSGCVDISFHTLSTEKKLLEDIDIENISCNNDKTLVRVIKNNDTYNYQVFLNCKTREGKLVYPNHETEVAPTTSCDGSVDSSGPKIIIEPNGSTDPVQKIKVNITIEDDYGYAPNAIVEYSWKKIGGSSILTRKKNFHNKFIPTKEPSLKINNISSPSDLNGKYVLEVTPISLMDSIGNINSDPETSQEYLFDNKEPTIHSSSVIKTDGSYLEFNGSDENGLKEFAITKSTTVPNTGWISISGNSYNYSKKKSVDTYYIHLKDKAGNVATKQQNVVPDIPSPPSISGNCDWDKSNRVVWVSTPAASVIGIKKYQYCTQSSPNASGCSWKNLKSVTDSSVPSLDISYYHSNNGDLINAFQGNVSSLVNHYRNYGQYEGRRASDSSWTRNSQIFTDHGDYYVFFRAEGKSGYMSNASNAVHIKIDKIGPRFNCSGKQFTNSTSDIASRNMCRAEPNLNYFFKCTVSDDESRLNNRYVEWGGNVELVKKGRYNFDDQPYLGGSYSFSDTLCTASEHGRVYLRSCDRAGNCNEKTINY